MNELKTYFNKFNRDMIFAAIAGILIMFIIRRKLEVPIYRFLLIFGPVVPDIFIPDHYPDAVCLVIGTAGGLCAYMIWDKKGISTVQRLLGAAIAGVALIGIAFFVQTTYISQQLKKPMEELNNDSIYLPTEIDISTEERLMVGDANQGTGKSRSLKLEEGSAELEAIYYGIQGLSNAVSYDSPFDNDYTISVIYKNNKTYKSRWLRTDEEYAYESLIGKGGSIGRIKYDAEALCSRVHGAMRTFRDFGNYKKEDFSAVWFNEMFSGGDANYTDIVDTELLLAEMMAPQNYSPDNEEKEYYGKFFTGGTITPEDGDLIAISYSSKTEQYEYKDVMLYDRSAKLLIFKDKDNSMRFVKQDLDSLFK
ncbi:MAG TPA: hypothetical protein DC038_00310 [Clostridiales bacterium]|nr:hypothetical protein [Clostridiales bacterium]